MNKPVFLCLGSNLGNRQAYLRIAVQRIERSIGPVVKTSSLYETKAWGFESDDHFLNQVIAVETSLTPEDVLNGIMQIEQECGRVRDPKNEYISRTLDIDILYFGDLIFYSDKLIIPHPRLEYRKFVLTPLAEADPDFIHPVLLKSNQELLEECADNLDVKLFQ